MCLSSCRWSCWWWRLCLWAWSRQTSTRWTRRCRWPGCSPECWTCSRLELVLYEAETSGFLLIFNWNKLCFRSKGWRSVWTSGAVTLKTWPCWWSSRPTTSSPEPVSPSGRRGKPRIFLCSTGCSFFCYFHVYFQYENHSVLFYTVSSLNGPGSVKKTINEFCTKLTRLWIIYFQPLSGLSFIFWLFVHIQSQNELVYVYFSFFFLRALNSLKSSSAPQSKI